MSQKKRATARVRVTEREYVCMCVFAYVCACVCVPCKSVSAFVRTCMRVLSRASPIFMRMRMDVRKWEEGGKKKTSKQTFQVFVAAWYARNIFHVYIITIN